MNEQEINALLEEREGYLRRGLKDRAKQVDECLAHLGHKVIESASVEPASERAMRTTVKKSK